MVVVAASIEPKPGDVVSLSDMTGRARFKTLFNITRRASLPPRRESLVIQTLIRPKKVSHPGGNGRLDSKRCKDYLFDASLPIWMRTRSKRVWEQ